MATVAEPESSLVRDVVDQENAKPAAERERSRMLDMAIEVEQPFVYTPTGKSNKITTLSPMLAKVIAMEFGYDAEWILHGDK